MTEMTLLAFDFGTARIGVAVGNTLIKRAQPLEIIDAEDNNTRFGRIQTLITEWAVRQLVVGIPYHPDGAAHEMTARCEKFARQLEGRFNIPVARVDERYSSAVIEGQVRGRRIDHQAAALILDQYFAEMP